MIARAQTNYGRTATFCVTWRTVEDPLKNPTWRAPATRWRRNPPVGFIRPCGLVRRCPIETQKVEGHKRACAPTRLERAEVASPVVSQPASPSIGASSADRPRTTSKHDSFLPHKQGERVQPAGSGGRAIDQSDRGATGSAYAACRRRQRNPVQRNARGRGRDCSQKPVNLGLEGIC